MTTQAGNPESQVDPHRRAGVSRPAEARHGHNRRLLVAPGCEHLLHVNNLDSLDAIFADSIGERLDKPGLPSWRQRRRLAICDGGPQTLYLKRFTDPPAAARREVRRSGTGAKTIAGLEWAWAQALARDGIPCVRLVALAEELHGSREVRSAILTAAVPGDSLERWAARWTQADRAAVRTLIGTLSRLAARLHACGYMHRDLYLSHVFYDPAAPPDDSLCLIDLQRMIRPTFCLRRWVVKDLAALNYSAPPNLFSRADRLRWLKLYLGAVKLDGSARRLVYRVIGKTLRIQRRDARRRLGEHFG